MSVLQQILFVALGLFGGALITYLSRPPLATDLVTSANSSAKGRQLPFSNALLTSLIEEGVTFENIRSLCEQSTLNLMRMAQALWDTETNGYSNHAQLRAVCSEWANRDPRGFLVWIAGKEDATPLQREVSMALAALAPAELQSALDLGLRITDGGSTSRRLTAAVAAAMLTQPDHAASEARLWALEAGLPPALVLAIRRGIANGLAERDPAAFLQQRAELSEDWDLALPLAVRTLAKADPQSLAATLGGIAFNPDNLRTVSSTLAELSRELSTDSLGAVVSWLEGTSMLGRFAEEAAGVIASQDIETALAFTDSIENPSARQLAAQAITRTATRAELPRLLELIPTTSGQAAVIDSWYSARGMTPQELIHELDSLSGSSIHSIATETANRRLASAHPSSCIALIESQPNPAVQRLLLVDALQQPEFIDAIRSSEFHLTPAMAASLQDAMRIHDSIYYPH